MIDLDTNRIHCDTDGCTNSQETIDYYHQADTGTPVFDIHVTPDGPEHRCLICARVYAEISDLIEQVIAGEGIEL